MKLKDRVSSLDEVPERFRAFYTKDDDEYVLDEDLRSGSGSSDDDAKRKLAEFRDNNRKLFAQVEELKKKLAEVGDAEEVKQGRAALAKLKELEEKELVDKGEFEELTKRRLAGVVEDYEKKLRQKEEAYQKAMSQGKTYKDELDGIKIDSLITKGISKVGVVAKGALDDVIHRARRAWRFDEDGNIRAFDGDEPVFGKSGDPLTVEEWGAQLLENAPHLFEASGGGGSGGGEKKTTANRSGTYVVDGQDAVAMGKASADILSGKAIVKLPTA